MTDKLSDGGSFLRKTQVSPPIFCIRLLVHWGCGWCAGASPSCRGFISSGPHGNTHTVQFRVATSPHVDVFGRCERAEEAIQTQRQHEISRGRSCGSTPWPICCEATALTHCTTRHLLKHAKNWNFCRKTTTVLFSFWIVGVSTVSVLFNESVRQFMFLRPFASFSCQWHWPGGLWEVGDPPPVDAWGGSAQEERRRRELHQSSRQGNGKKVLQKIWLDVTKISG